MTIWGVKENLVCPLVCIKRQFWGVKRNVVRRSVLRGFQYEGLKCVSVCLTLINMSGKMIQSVSVCFLDPKMRGEMKWVHPWMIRSLSVWLNWTPIGRWNEAYFVRLSVWWTLYPNMSGEIKCSLSICLTWILRGRPFDSEGGGGGAGTFWI